MGTPERVYLLMKHIRNIVLIALGMILWLSLLLYMLIGATLQESYKLMPLTEQEVYNHG